LLSNSAVPRPCSLLLLLLLLQASCAARSAARSILAAVSRTVVLPHTLLLLLLLLLLQVSCPANTAVCAFKLRVEQSGAADCTSLNDIEVACCAKDYTTNNTL
jgi:hypothetical protein